MPNNQKTKSFKGFKVVTFTFFLLAPFVPDVSANIDALRVKL